MATIALTHTITNGQTTDASKVMDNFNDIVDDYNGGITNANISASAAIAYSKLNLSTSILNADISASAAIAYSKLSLTGAIVNADLAGSIAASKISGTAMTLSSTDAVTGPKTFAKTVQTITAASDGATVTFDLSLGNVHTVTLGGNRTLALSNGSTGQVFIVRLLQDGTGSRTVTWFSTIKWPGGVTPTLTTTVSKADVFGFVTTGSGTYDGFILGQNL